MNFENNCSGNLTGRETAHFDAETGIKFWPAVYLQRYCAVEKVLKDNRWRKKLKKVVDFGCSEMHFFQYLKNIYGIEQVMEVDIDKDLLNRLQFVVMPSATDFLKRKSEPLDVSVVLGSISDPDTLLINTDAVVGIEIIEHVFPDVLEAIPYNIFGFVKPKVVIFTTPNADFNVLFPNFQGFRHDDHKFEWSREQFEDWATNITKRFPDYSVTFEGIGPGPDGTENLGCCSQMAVFVKEITETTNPTDDFTSYGICTYMSCTLKYLNSIREQTGENCNEKQIELKNNDKTICNLSRQYEVIFNVSYPVYEDSRSKEQKILDEVMYRVSLLGGLYGYYFNEKRNISEVPLSKIEPYVMDFCDFNELKTVLSSSDWVLEKCFTYENIEELCIIYDPNERDLGSSHSTEEEYLENYNHTSHSDQSDWEASSLGQ